MEVKYENGRGPLYELFCEVLEEERAKARNRLTGKIKSVIRKENFGKPSAWKKKGRFDILASVFITALGSGLPASSRSLENS